MTERRERIYDFGEFLRRFESLEPGQSMIYYEGFIAIGRLQSREVDKIARHALRLATPKGSPVRTFTTTLKRPDEAYGLGGAELYQRRVAITEYIYYIRRSL